MSFEDFPPSTGFQKIYNFRRLSHSRFYRCASVSFSTKADCKLLMNKYNIRTIVDLRGVGGMSSNIGPNNTLKFYPRLKDGNAKGERQTLTFDLFTADTKRRIWSRLYTLNSLKVFLCALLTFIFYTMIRIVSFYFSKIYPRVEAIFYRVPFKVDYSAILQ